MLSTRKPTKKQVEQIVEKHFEEESVSIRDLTSGGDHWVFKISLKKKTLVIRFPRTKEYQSKLSPAAWLCTQWRKKRIPLPEPILVTKSFCIERFIPGKTLKESILPARKKEKILFALGKLIRKMHTLKGKGWGEPRYSPKGKSHSWAAYLDRWWKPSIRTLRKKAFLPKKTIKRLEEIYAENLPFYSGKGAFLHNDIKPHHVILRENGIAGIIDASDFIVGDPLYELGLLREYTPKKEFEALMKGYGTRNEKKALFYTLYQLAGRIARYRGRRGKRKIKLREILDEYAEL